MQIQLQHPRVLHDGTGKGEFGVPKLYPKGQHEISDEVAKHWFTKAQMKSGDITVMADFKDEPAKKTDKSDKSDKAK